MATALNPCALAAMLLAAACSNDAQPTQTAQAGPAPAPPTAEPRQPPSASKQAPTESLEELEAGQYWTMRALGLVRSERELLDGVAIGIAKPGAEVRTFRVSRDALQDTTARRRAYMAAVHTLGQQLESGAEAAGTSAAARLEQLTKTKRGPALPWLRWYREFGDFVRYNDELERVEVDQERKDARRSASFDGLRLQISTESDRYKRDQPIPLAVRLVAEEGSSPRWVNQRLSLGAELELVLLLEEDDRSTAVDLRTAEPSGPPVREDFATLAPGASAQSTVQLHALVDGDLAPGNYAVRASYHNGATGEEFGLEAPVAQGDEPTLAGAWTGRLHSVSWRFRVVPW